VAATGERRPHAFISYVREDAAAVDRIQRVLESHGIPTWRDTDDLWPGDDWRSQITQAITENSLVFIACFSHNSLAREVTFQNDELTVAIEQMRLRRPDQPWLIPLRLSDCTIPFRDLGGGRTLSSLQRVDLFGDRWDREAMRLVRGVRRIMSSLDQARRLEEQSEPRLIWGNVPHRNWNFTGREDLLLQLRRQLTSDVGTSVAHVLHGMGGVGKTQLAIEHVYRHASDYQVVWWIPAEQVALVRSSLAALATRLGLTEAAPWRVEDAAHAVLDALRRGDPCERWLLVFDNADQPEEIQDLLPTGTGHVAVTTRNHGWGSGAEVIDVDVFTRQESLDLLGRLLPDTTPAEWDRLAEELGDLPLALVQAATALTESGRSVDEYLDLLAHESSKVLTLSPPQDYAVSVAAAWRLSMTRLEEDLPFAWELLRLCAFFGPEPIKRDLLKNGRYVLGPPLKSDIGNTVMLSRATSELGRHALARIDNSHRTFQVHRLIQKLIRDSMSLQEAGTVRHWVHLLLAAADPDEPDDVRSWADYNELLPHVIASQVVECADPDVRRLVRNIVRCLLNLGDLATCDALCSDALKRWTKDSEPDDLDLVILSGQRADLLWAVGAYSEAFELRRTTLQVMCEVLGESDVATLAVASGHGADLRSRGEFAAALELDQRTLARCRSVLGDDDPQTFPMAINVATDQVLNGRYDAAFATDSLTHENCLGYFGRNDHPWVVHAWAAMGRDLCLGGRYPEALEYEGQAYIAFADLVRERTLPLDHPWVLRQARDLAIARRRMGQFEGAADLSEEVYQRAARALGATHPDTLAVAVSLGNARRALGDVMGDAALVDRANLLIEAAHGHYRTTYGTDHPLTHLSALNLAVARRTGHPAEARSLLEEAVAGLRAGLGSSHDYTLTCMTALASVLVDGGEVERAGELGEQALAGLRQRVGPDHPRTLACASNLALDLAALGDVSRSRELSADTQERYRTTLPADHVDMADAMRGRRITVDMDPPFL